MLTRSSLLRKTIRVTDMQFEAKSGFPVTINGTFMARLQPVPLIHPTEHVTVHLATERGEFERDTIYRVTIEKVGD